MGRSDFHDRSAFPAADTADDGDARSFVDQALSGRVLLDNTSFQRCNFKRAVLVYTGGAPPLIRDCDFSDVAFEFQGAAGRTLALLQAMSAPKSGMREIVKASFGRIFGH